MASGDSVQTSQDTHDALNIARDLIAHGVPVFAAAPCPSAWGTGVCDRPGHASGKQEYDLPPKWQQTVPAEMWLDKWQPGWALAAVGGHAADILDEDPQHGGDASLTELEGAGHMPRVYGVADTPSGGHHMIIAPLREREANGFLPGLDYQGGDADGGGRAFVWIAPTVKRSKIDGIRKAYRWAQPPDLDWLTDFDGPDGTGDGLISRLAAARTKPAGSRDPRVSREYTEADAQRFCSITLDRLERAEIGGIEDAANAAACQLSHFVPSFWTEEFAFAVLMEALKRTKYDPDGPSSWTAEKFHAVIADIGGRAPADWKAVRRPETVEQAMEQTEPDAVEALLAEMLTDEQIAELPAPRHLIRDVLTLDSESWIIGAPGSKKSFVALDMAGHVATGKPWQGLETTQGKVVMIVAEGAGGSGKRVRAWRKRNGPMKGVYFLPRPVQSAKIEDWAVLVKACARLDPVLIVVDTQARVTVGLEENSARDMGVYVDAVRSLREATGACVLSIHHTGRRGGDARGSSALDGAQSTELTVDVPQGSLRGSLKITKQKDIEEGPAVPLVFEVEEVGTDDLGRPITSLILAPVGAFRLASGQGGEPERTAVYVPTFDERDRWRTQILDTLYAYAVPGQGMTRAAVARSLAEVDGVAVGKVQDNGAFKTAFKDLAIKDDPNGDRLLVEYGSGNATRYEISSLPLLAGMAVKFPHVEQDE